MARLKDRYKSEIAGAMQQKFGYKNIMQVPKLDKIVINMGLGNVKDDSKKFEAAVSELALIAGLGKTDVSCKYTRRNHCKLHEIIESRLCF